MTTIAGIGTQPMAWLVLVIFLGAVIQGSTGFGLGLIAAPIIAMIDPELLPAALILIGVPLPLLMAIRERVQVRWEGLGWALLGRTVGTGAGLAAVVWFSARALATTVAIAVLLAVTVSVIRWRPTVTTRSLLVAGFLSGAAGTATSIGSPPMALLFQRAPGAQLRSTLGWFFFFGTALSLLGLLLSGQIARMHLEFAAWAILPMVAGFMVSGRLRKFVDNGRTRGAVLAMATLSALALLVRSIAQV